jgi:hypothetical protein
MPNILPWAPLEAADRREKRATIRVADILLITVVSNVYVPSKSRTDHSKLSPNFIRQVSWCMSIFA